ncbi:choloylglycine hydrolase family protein [Xanthobacter sp. DSM 24535]|uniref:linear amide C-N hydrolase n=1 Tax=Roseixanthobacter psychrophilus TaxID=3119917 RepID=UPI003728E1DB
MYPTFFRNPLFHRYLGPCALAEKVRAARRVRPAEEQRKRYLLCYRLFYSRPAFGDIFSHKSRQLRLPKRKCEPGWSRSRISIALIRNVSAPRPHLIHVAPFQQTFLAGQCGYASLCSARGASIAKLGAFLMLSRFARSTAIAVATMMAVALPLQQANACTSFLLHSLDGGFVYGRTMEFGLPMQSQFTIVPRKLALVGTGPDGTPNSGLPWATKFGAVGLNGLGLSILVDGMNEAGLAGGLLYLPGVAEYQEVAPGEAKTSIASYELLLYVLTNFASVEEVKAGLPKIKVNRSIQTTFKMAVPLHMTLHDAKGKSVVVEYIGGELKIHDNPTTVLTNAPNFDWHIANLANYLNLSAYDPKPIKIGDLTLTPPSTGTGALGLPGDVSSPSRFVRAFQYTRAAPPLAKSKDAVDLAFHLLNTFDIAPGIVRTEADSQAGGGVAGIETTEWAAVADLKTKHYYVRTFENSQTQFLDLNKADLDAKAIKMMPITVPATVIDVLR